MNAKQFYDEKSSTNRSLDQGNCIRNTHNFIKAVVIKRFVSNKKRILDLGCGQGGDLMKIKYATPSLYVGIDISPTAVASAQARASKINMRCRSHFLCLDFTSRDWNGYPPYDVINCQFAIQFAFKTQSQAEFTLEKISRFLTEDGLFIGTLPLHTDADTYSEVVIKLPDDSRYCKEPAVHPEDFIRICAAHNLQLVMMESFDIFYSKAIQKEPALANKMKAHVAPDPNNMVFAFQKRITENHICQQ